MEGRDPEPPFWARDADELLQVLEASRQGLTGEAARARLAAYGSNRLAEVPSAGMLRIFFGQFTNPLVLILVFAAIVAAVAGEPAESIIIIIVLLGSALLATMQEYGASSAVARLRARLHLQVSVLRDGAEVQIPSELVVPGDVVVLAAGVMVPADGVLLEARDLFVSQAALTGESFPVDKAPGRSSARATLAERTNVVFLGTSVRSGTGRMLVVRTGKGTEYGKISQELRLRPPESEFERGVRSFGYLLTRVVLLLVLVVFAANVLLDRPPIEALLFALALAVGMSPELLPAIISVTLARGAHRMVEEGVIVRRLAAIETLGSVDVLCCDKTGTLTEGSVRLQGAVDVSGRPSVDVGRALLLNARLQTGIPNPLDDAILAAAPTSPTAEASARKLDEIPYDFVRRRITVVVEDGEGARLVTKGAVKEVLESCSEVGGPGRRAPLDPDLLDQLHARVVAWSDEGYRVLAVATKTAERKERYSREDEVGLVLEGFALFLDRPKPGVSNVLAEISGLGVGVKVVTGDSVHVARHVARSVGLDADAVLTGEDLQDTRDEALWRLAESTSVFAEVDPHQKERIILALRRSGHVVGYLGDGINDAPALHSADVGISVEGAVDVARESADLVLLSRDLEVLRRGIEAGRKALANTMKYIHITTSANFGNMISMAAASFFLPFLPLLAPQILLNNFLSDIPSMALAGDDVERDWMTRPHSWDMRSIRRFMIVFGLVSSLFDLLTFGLLLTVFAAGPEVFRTGWFVLSLLTELIVLFVVRTRGAFVRTPPSRGLLVSALVIGVAALLLPFTFVGEMFEFVPLPVGLVGTLLLLVVAYGLATEWAKRRFYARELAAASAGPSARRSM